MEYRVTTHIKENRSVFGYGRSGLGVLSGEINAFDTIEFLNDFLRTHDWAHAQWNGDTLIIEFEERNVNSQLTEEVMLTPESYGEFILLKKWKIDNGFEL